MFKTLGSKFFSSISSFRFNRRELAGALGDIGVLLPLAIALILLNGLNPTAVFLVAGLLYISAGLYYRVPMAVQPLKALAAIAIAVHAGPSVIAAAGILMGIILLILAVTGLSDQLAKIFPLPIIRGIQLGVGLILVKNGFVMVIDPSLFKNGGEAVLHLGSLLIPAGVVLAVAAGFMILFLMKNEKVPAAIAVIGFGFFIGLLWGLPQLGQLSLGPVPFLWAFPSSADFVTALFLLVLPQIPLTFGNSVVCAADTSKRYYGEQAKNVTPKGLCATLGLGNMVAGFAGGMPLCHGSGGITAHYKFGARTGGAPIIIGAILVITALVLGASAVKIFGLIPLAILGALLVYVGIEHAMLIGDLLGKRADLWVALLIGAVSIASNSVFYGFLSGMVLLLAFRFLPVESSLDKS